MNILNKFTIQNLKLNKKRTIVTIIGIMLSSALICGVVGLVSSFQQTLINIEKREDGDYHVSFENVAEDKVKYIENNNNISQCFLTKEGGWAYLEGGQNENKPYVHILEYDEKALEKFGVNLIEGRKPENDEEILISEHIKTNGRVELKVGEKITLNVGTRKFEDNTIANSETPYMMLENGTKMKESIVDTTARTYTIVGIMKRPNNYVEGFESAGYTVITYMEQKKGDLNVLVKYKNAKEYIENTNKILQTIEMEKENSYTNRELLRYEGALDDNALSVIYGIAAVVLAIIVTSSVFVIRNSFSISVAEKNRQYGMMSSVGATAKQIRKSVLFEGFIIGLIAVPLGILLGVVAIVILLKVVNYLLGDMLNGIEFMYFLPVIPVLISIAISALTIYLSCLIPAIIASKISPIESIRGNNDIKIKAKKLKTSKLVKKIFGIGGVIASKNLKRSRKKYRTTVISIVISIVIFVSLSTFIACGNKASGLYYVQMNFNVLVSEGTEELYKGIIQLDNIENYSYYYETVAEMDLDKYATEVGKQEIEDSQESVIRIIAYNNEYYKQYVQEQGLKDIDYKTSAILIDELVVYHEDNTKSFEKIYNIKENDVISVKMQGKDRNINIVKNTDVRPMGLEGTFYTNGALIVSQDFVENITENANIYNLFINSNNSEELENTINDLIKTDEKYSEIKVFNYDTYTKQENRMVLVISIFLYGFMTVITLIGVTNIFNTITTNMILRSKEFAMLKSIGMTLKEFNRMIRLESILYGLKALFIGIPIGLVGSYLIYKSFTLDIDIGYSVPWSAIIISIVFVFLIVGLTMKHSLNKINKKNIIDTIRQDNI